MDLLSLSYMAHRKSRFLLALVVIVITLMLIINYFMSYKENVGEKHGHDFRMRGASIHHSMKKFASKYRNGDLAQDVIKVESKLEDQQLNQYHGEYQFETKHDPKTGVAHENLQFQENAVYVESSLNPNPKGFNSPKDNTHGNSKSQHNVIRGISESHRRAITNYASNLLLCKEVPGMTIGIVKDEDHWVLPLGIKDLNNESPVTSKTNFFLGSVTKTFTAQLAALMIQESEGSLTWDTPLVQIMGPDFRLATAELTNEVTLRDLLSHRSGLVSGNLAIRSSFPKDMNRMKLLRSFDQIPANAELGKEFLYSNMGYTLAGTVIEHYWKRSWEDLIQEKLLRPIGMNQSIIVLEAKDLSRHDSAKPYVPVEGGIEDCNPKLYELGPAAVAGSLAASAEDMIKWLKFTLNPHKFFKRKKHLPDLLADMWLPNIQLEPKFKAKAEKKKAHGWPVDDLNLGYGMGWFLNKYRGMRTFWHGGGLYSYYSLVWILPESNLGIFISINGYKGCSDDDVLQQTRVTDNLRRSQRSSLPENHNMSQNNMTIGQCQCGSGGFSIIESIAYVITDTLLQQTPWIYEKNGCQYPQPWIKCGKRNDSGSSAGFMMNTKKQNPLNEMGIKLNSYKGVYSHKLLGNVYIYSKDPETDLHFHLRLLDGVLKLRNFKGNETVFGLECTGNYRFLSRPDRFVSQSGKQTFILKFYLRDDLKADVIHIYYSENEKPFVFQRIQVGTQ